MLPRLEEVWTNRIARYEFHPSSRRRPKYGRYPYIRFIQAQPVDSRTIIPIFIDLVEE